MSGSKSSSKNRRQFFRIKGNYTVTLEPPAAKQAIPATCLDLSACGMLLKSQQKLKAGETVNLVVEFPEGIFQKIRRICKNQHGTCPEGKLPALRLQAKVVRDMSKDGENIYGIEFVQIDQHTLAFLVRFVLEIAVQAN